MISSSSQPSEAGMTSAPFRKLWTCLLRGQTTSISPCQLRSVSSYASVERKSTPYSIKGEAIQEVECVRDLGVYVDNKLNFGEHVTEITRKASMKINFMFRTFSVCTPSPYLVLFKSIVLPTLLYASEVWFPKHKYLMKKLERLQNYFKRRVENRCGLELNSLELAGISSLMKEYDRKTLRKIVEDHDILSLFFTVHSTSRRGLKYRPREYARKEATFAQFAWRVTRTFKNTWMFNYTLDNLSSISEKRVRIYFIRSTNVFGVMIPASRSAHDFWRFSSFKTVVSPGLDRMYSTPRWCML